MTTTKRKGYHIYLTDKEQRNLQSIAKSMGCRVQRGPTSGKHSFRILLHEIAAGNLQVTKAA